MLRELGTSPDKSIKLVLVRKRGHMNSPTTRVEKSIDRTPPDVNVLFEQYKLAVEMADRMSAKREAANKFFVGLVSAFGGLYALLNDAPLLLRTAWEYVLPMLAICWCVLWWFTIRHYRRLNQIKWKVIEEELESNLPLKPFRSEDALLGKRRFGLTKLELIIPVIVGLVFVLLAARPFLNSISPAAVQTLPK
jgi:hypothetical protein